MKIAWRRTVWVGGLALVILGAFAWLSARRADNEPPRSALTPSEAAAPKEELPKPIGDDDQDGLSNWEEALRQTDPENPDSDGDGTSDKDELERGRNPLKKGPDDVFPNVSVLQLPPPPRAKVLAPSRVPMPQETAPEPSSPPPSKTSTVIESIAVNPELHAFGNALGAALAPVTNGAFTQSEQALIAQAVPSRDGSALPALAPLAQSYERATDNLQGIVAPPEGTALLANLKDGYARLGRAVLELSKGGAELKVQSERWTEYSASVMAVGKALNESIGFFLERRITFGADDPGRIFVMDSR